MKTLICVILLLSSQAFAVHAAAVRVLENEVAKVTLTRVVRPVAEPASKPIAVEVKVECKAGYTQLKKQISIPVCDTDLQNTSNVKITAKHVQFAHFSWDAVKSSNNSQGNNFCMKDQTNLAMAFLKDFCVATKKQ